MDIPFITLKNVQKIYRTRDVEYEAISDVSLNVQDLSLIHI